MPRQRAMISLISSNLNFCLPHFVFRPSGKAPQEILAIKRGEIALFLGFSRESQGNYVFSEEWVLVNLLRTKFPLVMRTSPD